MRNLLGWVAVMLAACAGRNATTDAGARDVADVAEVPATRVGAGCTSDGDCDGLRCATRFERMCAGPVRPHAWSFEFPGGQCNPALDVARGDIPGGCPGGSSTMTVFVGCDGVPFRFCARRCAGDADCRAAEGYRCERDALLCLPPSLLSKGPDAGVDGG